MASGLEINLLKSKLTGIGVSKEDINLAASIVGCSMFSPPFHYLGVKVGASMSRLNSWKEITAKVSSRLSKWKLKTPSIGGRLTLLKCVLTAIPIYHMSLFKVPAGILKVMELIHSSKLFMISRELWTFKIIRIKALYGDFSVSSVCNVIDDVYLPKLDIPTRWVKKIPIKVNILAWKISLDRLPTCANLPARGLEIPSILCPSCNEVVESTSHIFFSCSLARQVMCKLGGFYGGSETKYCSDPSSLEGI
ncbi:RNA-directed DNA polymerase, eukaryota [Tanacetum coccineum]